MKNLASVQDWLKIPLKYQHARFDDPTFRHDTGVVRFLEDDFHASGKPVALLSGATGSGKSYGAMAWFVSHVEVRYNLIGKAEYVHGAFLTAYDLAEKLYRKQFKELDRLRAVNLLFLDELGTEPGGYKGQDFLAHFENLINTRIESNKRTVLATNYTPEAFKEAYGDRIYSRLFESGMAYQTVDPDFRVTGRTQGLAS